MNSDNYEDKTEEIEYPFEPMDNYLPSAADWEDFRLYNSAHIPIFIYAQNRVTKGDENDSK